MAHISRRVFVQAAVTFCSTSRGVPLVIASAFSVDIFSFVPATFTLSFNRPLSASFVIHLAPATPTRNAPARAENSRLVTCGPEYSG